MVLPASAEFIAVFFFLFIVCFIYLFSFFNWSTEMAVLT